MAAIGCPADHGAGDFTLDCASAYALRIQPVDATHALNRSAGVLKSKVFLGRSFSLRATALSFTCECTDKSVPLGKYCRNKPLVFSFDPRCQGFWGSQK